MPVKTKEARVSVRNWSKYNESLVARGSITFWFSDEALAAWYHLNAHPQQGHPFLYSDSTLELCLTVRELMRLPLRQTEGLMGSLLGLIRPGLRVPDYSSMSKRASKLGISLPVLPKTGKIDVVLDSTGLKVYGEGEWKVRKHGAGKRRTWRKLHVAMDPATHEIVAQVLTTNGGHDADQVSQLLAATPARIRKVTGDGAYDMWKVYEAVSSQGAKSCIAPRHDAKIKRHANRPGPKLERDEAIRAIRQVGRPKWKRLVGYHRRSLVETCMFRLKTCFGATLKNRALANQQTETSIRCKLLNHFTHSLLPLSRSD